MNTYHICNKTSGQYLGSYQADTEDAALDAMAVAAGYDSFALSCEALGMTVDEARADLAPHVERDEGSPRSRLILDNAGGITLQLGGWGGDFDVTTIAACAKCIAEWLHQPSTDGWEGTDEAALLTPTQDDIRSGGYKIVELDELHTLDPDGGEAEARLRMRLEYLHILETIEGQ
jgi:hypothetical protein